MHYILVNTRATFMDVIESEPDLKFTNAYCYRFNSKIAVFMERNHKWKDAMVQWIYAMHKARTYENREWAHQRALYCRKQCLKNDGEVDLTASGISAIHSLIGKNY